jgi:Transport and Golgi organisation 2
MCTVTFIPISPNGFILTSNRDEKVIREKALPPLKNIINGIEVIYPKDPKGNGTWIASSFNGYTLCLLNGAFEPHEVRSNYKYSRGKIILDFFNYSDISKFCKQYDFSNIEPFTLLIAYCDIAIVLTEIKWDGAKLYIDNKDVSRPSIWSSVTLYDKAVISEREQWLSEYLKTLGTVIKQGDIVKFHRETNSDDKVNGVLIDRNNIYKTVSVSSVFKNANEHRFCYFDLIDNIENHFRVFNTAEMKNKIEYFAKPTVPLGFSRLDSE